MAQTLQELNITRTSEGETHGDKESAGTTFSQPICVVFLQFLLVYRTSVATKLIVNSL